MSLAAIAIAVLWLLIGVIILAGVIYLAMWVIESFVYPIPEKIKQGVWVIVLLLCLIALIITITTGKAPFQTRLGNAGGAIATLSAPSTGHL